MAWVDVLADDVVCRLDPTFIRGFIVGPVVNSLRDHRGSL